MGEFEGIVKSVTVNKLSVHQGGKQRDDVLEAISGALGNFCSNVGQALVTKAREQSLVMVLFP